MAGNREGGLKAAATNKAKYGDAFYKTIGKAGGHWSSPAKGFGSNRELAKEAGKRGGIAKGKQRTQCMKGLHELAGANVVLRRQVSYGKEYMSRICLECERARVIRHREQKQREAEQTRGQA